MAVSTKEVLKGCVLNYEGKARIVKGINDYILLEDKKEWIGGSLIDGEPLTVEWIAALSFVDGGGGWYFKDDPLHRTIWLMPYKDTWQVAISVPDHDAVLYTVVQFVHQLQLSWLALTKEHLPVPKLKK